MKIIEKTIKMPIYKGVHGETQHSVSPRGAYGPSRADILLEMQRNGLIDLSGFKKKLREVNRFDHMQEFAATKALLAKKMLKTYTNEHLKDISVTYVGTTPLSNQDVAHLGWQKYCMGFHQLNVPNSSEFIKGEIILL